MPRIPQAQNPAVVQLLMADSRLDVNVGDSAGASPFFVACETGNEQTVQVFPVASSAAAPSLPPALPPPPDGALCPGRGGRRRSEPPG